MSGIFTVFGVDGIARWTVPGFRFGGALGNVPDRIFNNYFAGKEGRWKALHIEAEDENKAIVAAEKRWKDEKQ
jgi:hypothetical protein